MKTALSIPDHLFEAAEKLAQTRGWSRSKLYATALADYLKACDSTEVTAQLDQIYETEDSSLDSQVSWIQEASLPEDEW